MPTETVTNGNGDTIFSREIPVGNYGVATAIADPGSDSNLATEKAVRDAVDAGGGGANGVAITPTTVTISEILVTPKNALGAFAINVGKALNTKSVSADATFTFSGTPAAADTWFALQLTETSGTARTITIPSSVSVARGATITSFLLPASSTVLLQWLYTGSAYVLLGDPANINNLTLDAAPDPTNDLLAVWDTSASAPKRTPLNSVLMDLSTTQTIAGIKNFSGTVRGLTRWAIDEVASGRMLLGSGFTISWNSGTGIVNSEDIRLSRQAANILQIGNGATNALGHLACTNGTFSGTVTAAGGVATPAGGSTSARLLLGSTSGFGIYYGSGAPTVSAAQGSLYLRSDGSGTGDRCYINTNGSTTWTAIATAA